MSHQLARERDAAFFEDWSEWISLDGLAGRKSHYYCLLRKNVAWMRGPCFEIAIPEQEPIARLMRAVPGCKKHPSVKYHRLGCGPGPDTVYFVPAENWPDLLRALPAIKEATTKWARSRQ